MAVSTHSYNQEETFSPIPFYNQTKQITAVTHDAQSGLREISLIILFPLSCKITRWKPA